MIKERVGRNRQPDNLGLEQWGWRSLALNILLAVLHGLVAYASGSLAVIAELIHNTVDLISSSAILIGLKLATRKSKEFPYGLYKIENLLAAFLAILIFVSAYEILLRALLAPVSSQETNAWMIILLVITTILPLVFSHFELRAAKAANSPALIADAKEYRVHMYTTALALLALLSQGSRFPFDRIAAALIIIAVLKTGWELLRDAMRVLLDASLDSKTLDHVSALISAAPAVAELRWLTGRNAGRFRFVEAGVIVRVDGLKKAEEALCDIESEIRQEVPYIERVLLHIEPGKSTNRRYAVPLAARDGAISNHFGEAPYFAIVTMRRNDSVALEQRIVRNDYQKIEKAKGIRVAEWLVREKIDVVLLKEDIQGKGPEYVFKDAGIRFHRTDRSTLTDVVFEMGSYMR
ncbi:MAG: cation diffusion facilitator family transporter [Desulfobulbus sp.]|nr:cation diffusion facilitator family transporter [Desulfobulbus sp.]